jgi:hypothetical protein
MGWTSNPSATNVRGMMAIIGMFNLWHIIELYWHFGMGGCVHPTECMGAAWEKWQPC